MLSHGFVRQCLNGKCTVTCHMLESDVARNVSCFADGSRYIYINYIINNKSEVNSARCFIHLADNEINKHHF